MEKSDFWIYSEENEKENKVYWEFTNTPAEEILELRIYLEDVKKIILNIKNSELKEKMIKKVYDILISHGILLNGGEYFLSGDIFSEEQESELIKHEILEIGLKRIKDSKNINSVLDYINLILKLKDTELIYDLFTRVFEALNEAKDVPKLMEKNARIINFVQKKNPEIGNKLLEKYASKLPKEFIKYLEVQGDEEYLRKKSDEFNKKNIRIGIDPRISFGPEIEADNDLDVKFDIKNQKGFEDYDEKMEATVPMGTEIVCPPLHDTPEDVSKLCALLETMKEIGFYYDEVQENAAGQINIGLDYLNTPKSIMNFFEIFGNCEELLFHISNEEGQLTRQSVYVNSRFKAISEMIGTMVIDEDITRDQILEMFYVPFLLKGKQPKHIKGLQYKKNSVGVRDFGHNEIERLEIKIPNGSTEYSVWIDNIRLYGKIVEMSRTLAEIETKGDITEKEERLLWLKEELKDERNTLEDKLFVLMDLLFEDDEIKQIYVNRFYTLQQKIKETGTTKYKDNKRERRITGEKAFGIVDFEELYNSQRKRISITYDPETQIYDNNGREETLER